MYVMCMMLCMYVCVCTMYMLHYCGVGDYVFLGFGDLKFWSKLEADLNSELRMSASFGRCLKASSILLFSLSLSQFLSLFVGWSRKYGTIMFSIRCCTPGTR